MPRVRPDSGEVATGREAQGVWVVSMFETEAGNRATVSACGLYRYQLWRCWGDGKTACFVLLNPSVADADNDDPTIRRCIGFAKRERCSRLCVVNLFAGRATDPRDMQQMADPIGPRNDLSILEATIAEPAPLVIAAWGAGGAYRGRAQQIVTALAFTGVEVMCLGVTKDGQPRHLLYVKADEPLVPFKGSA